MGKALWMRMDVARDMGGRLGVCVEERGVEDQSVGLQSVEELQIRLREIREKDRSMDGRLQRDHSNIKRVGKKLEQIGVLLDMEESKEASQEHGFLTRLFGTFPDPGPCVDKRLDISYGLTPVFSHHLHLYTESIFGNKRRSNGAEEVVCEGDDKNTRTNSKKERLGASSNGNMPHSPQSVMQVHELNDDEFWSIINTVRRPSFTVSL